MNLLNETLDVMRSNAKSPADVAWVGVHDAWVTWETFAGLADVEYDSGFGSDVVARDLHIVFCDGEYMSRGEYAGSEWWNFHTTPTRPALMAETIDLFPDDNWKR